MQTARSKYPQWYAMLLCTFHTGVRSGELSALGWDDIDYSVHFVHVRGSVSRYSRGVAGSTKTDSTRKVDMSDELAAELKAHRKRLQEEYLKDGKNELPEWVFPDRFNGPLDIENFKKRQWKTILDKAKVRHRNFHQTRHTFATILLMNGESIVYVQNQLGHSSIRMTVDTYSHWIPGSNRQAVNRLPGVTPAKAKVGWRVRERRGCIGARNLTHSASFCEV